MQKNQHPAVAQLAATKALLKKYRKPVIITFSVAVLNIIFGFDPKFTFINIIWLFI